MMRLFGNGKGFVLLTSGLLSPTCIKGITKLFLFLFVDEGKDGIDEMSAPWKETTLSTICSNCESLDIFNTNEFGLFKLCQKSFTSQNVNVVMGDVQQA